MGAVKYFPLFFIAVLLTLHLAGICDVAAERPLVRCKYGKPAVDASGVEYFCGRGENRRDCPRNTICNTDPVDRFAVCCPRIFDR
ncbi:hypothetical protein BV898_09791 [Hypsibius exemplaris]|uniref:Single domain-containing protein n=1 Tax=Hypsibius exemplaris TaxID=2072580 RepID=A0A1W0WLE6_HYPEX|nr:hypothetical protein BV898_09791 [Hypsibius exemplaris]